MSRVPSTANTQMDDLRYGRVKEVTELQTCKASRHVVKNSTFNMQLSYGEAGRQPKSCQCWTTPTVKPTRWTMRAIPPLNVETAICTYVLKIEIWAYFTQDKTPNEHIVVIGFMLKRKKTDMKHCLPVQYFSRNFLCCNTQTNPGNILRWKKVVHAWVPAYSGGFDKFVQKML